MRTRLAIRSTNEEIETQLARNALAVVACGASGELGRLPVGATTVLAEAFALKFAEQADAVAFTELGHLHGSDAGVGTIRMSVEQGSAHVGQIALSLLRQGFRRQIHVSASPEGWLTGGILAIDHFDGTKAPILCMHVPTIVERHADASGVGMDRFVDLILGAYRAMGRMEELEVDPEALPLPAGLPEGMTAVTASGQPAEKRTGIPASQPGENLESPPAERFSALLRSACPVGAVGFLKAQLVRRAMAGRGLRSGSERLERCEAGERLLDRIVAAVDPRGVAQTLEWLDEWTWRDVLPKYRHLPRNRFPGLGGYERAQAPAEKSTAAKNAASETDESDMDASEIVVSEIDVAKDDASESDWTAVGTSEAGTSGRHAGISGPSRIYASMTGDAIRAFLARNDLIYVPFGAVKQHGALPLNAEGMVPLAVAMRLAERTDGLVLDGLPYFFSGAAATGRGSVQMPMREGTAFLSQLISSLQAQGFRRVVLVGTHGPAFLTGGPAAVDVFDETKAPPLYLDYEQAARAGGFSAEDREALICGAYRMLGREAELPPAVEAAGGSSSAGSAHHAPMPSLERLLLPYSTVGFYALPDAVAPDTPHAREAMFARGLEQLESLIAHIPIEETAADLRALDRWIAGRILPAHGAHLPPDRWAARR